MVQGVDGSLSNAAAGFLVILSDSGLAFLSLPLVSMLVRASDIAPSADRSESGAVTTSRHECRLITVKMQRTLRQQWPRPIKILGQQPQTRVAYRAGFCLSAAANDHPILSVADRAAYGRFSPHIARLPARRATTIARFCGHRIYTARFGDERIWQSLSGAPNVH
jgi:hypothetical protein